ncbi:hypothetical protein ACS5NO_14120 [Larkinella sp. GY13]|uniref:hypothetical protein n=1 Tax=Larkinella sp. GY13 TaxID=3453720 RepID=UPI003EEFE2FA
MSKYIIFLLMMVNHGGFGQDFLLFSKKSYRQVLYKQGDIISFRLKEDKSKFTAQIEGFEDSLILLGGMKVKLVDITHLYVDDKTKDWYIIRYKYKRIFPVAGVGFLLIDAFNTHYFDKKTLIISGYLVCVGLLAKWLIKDSIRIRGRKKLAIITRPIS